VRLRQVVVEQLAVLRQKRVQVHQPGEARRRLLGDPGDYHAPVAVADQHHAREVVELQDGEDILDVGLETDVLGEQVRPLPQAGHCRREDVVARGPQPGCDLFPAPSTEPCPVDQYARRAHVYFPRRFVAISQR
jgi:hypothetical protein